MLDCGYIHLVQPVDGSHCCEDGLQLFSQNTALCVAERIPHSFFTNSILMFFTVFMSLICRVEVPKFVHLSADGKGFAFLDFRQK